MQKVSNVALKWKLKIRFVSYTRINRHQRILMFLITVIILCRLSEVGTKIDGKSLY